MAQTGDNLPTAAIVLAGGFGTRLRAALPDGLPKPLAPVAGRPFIERLIAMLRDSGIHRIVVSTGYAAELIAEALGDGTALGCRITYAYEKKPLGTGGAAAFAARSLAPDESAGPVVVMNGDSYCEVSFSALAQAFAAAKARAMIVVRQVDDPSRYGTVEIDEATGAVLAFREKAEGPSGASRHLPDGREGKEETYGAGAGGWINGGIYLLDPVLLAEIPPDTNVSIERDFFPSLVGRGLYAHQTAGMFIDIGVPEELARAQELFKEL